MKRISPTFVEVDLDALRSNYRQLKKRLPSRVRTLCVVKSNAYGHGAARVARALQEEGADFFGTGTIEEGTELREAGIKRPVLVLTGLPDLGDDSFESLLRYQLTPVLFDLVTAERLHDFLSHSRAHSRTRLPIHLKVDTGMTRLGILPKDVGSFCDRLKEFNSLEPIGLLSHLADAGEEEFTSHQIRSFEGARRDFQKRFPGPKLFHIANSQASIDRRTGGIGSEWVARLGIALYGAYPTDRARRVINLRPVLRWKSRIISLKRVPPRTAVGYGRTFLTKKESLIGVLPVGYADGYMRCLSNQSRVIVRGKLVPVVGTICMDMMMIDLTSVPKAQLNDEAVLIGRSSGVEIRVEEIAKLAKSISYEILCRIAERIPRLYS